MALSDAEKLAIVEKLYAATGVGDHATAESLLTDDFAAIEADGLPFGGAYRGKTGLRDLYTKVMSMMDVAGLEVVDHTAGGDHVVTIINMKFADPAIPPAQICELFRFRGDKVCEIRPYYFDPAPVLAACRAKAGA